MSQENVNFEGDIFNLSGDSFVNPPKKSKGFEIYQPNADDGREGVYKSLVRFLPYWKNPNNSKVRKYYVWVQDPVTGENFSVDCPSTVNEKSILKDAYWKLKNSTSAAEQELSKLLSRAENYYCLVQILKDSNKPELEGKIMVYKFGKKINDKIESQLKPASEYQTACNPFDLFEGKVFAMHVVKKANWNNYDMCEFVGEKTPLLLEQKPLQRTKEDMDKVLTWLKENSPELDKYEYKPWSDELNTKVMTALKNIIPDARLIEQVLAGGSKFTPKATSTSAPVTSSAPVTNVSRDEMNEVANVSTPAATPAATKPASSVDDLYAGL